MRFLEVFLLVLCRLPLKWESSPESKGYVTWCEASIHMVKDAPILLMKRVQWQPLDHAFPLVGDFQLWDKWVDSSRWNVEFASCSVESRVPTLVGKVATLCSSTHAKVINRRSIMHYVLIVMGFDMQQEAKQRGRVCGNSGCILIIKTLLR